MFPLKVFRFFEPTTDIPQTTLLSRRQSTRQASGIAEEDLRWPQAERRQNQDRRNNDRREKQQAILLNTRKLQGRRKDPGRRQEDKLAAPNSHINISVKG
ncbi:hypothetical protein [Undibacterium sp. TJN19]|uniref:hypothetical protein n=1 Tax=Undibacterium sp. TJN19 TaxID=3413055 RepID=UPI003BF1BEDE